MAVRICYVVQYIIALLLAYLFIIWLISVIVWNMIRFLLYNNCKRCFHCEIFIAQLMFLETQVVISARIIA